MVERLIAWVAHPYARGAAIVALAAIAVGVAWPPSERAPAISWETLLAPLAPGADVVGGYRLSPPRRGVEHDVVFSARRAAAPGIAAAHVEIHVVDRGRWQGIMETQSFGVAWEVPRSSAPEADCRAVTTRVRDAIAAHDRRGLGPVDSIALRAPAALAPLPRALGRMTGVRAVVLAAALIALAILVGTFRSGAASLAGILFFGGLALRVAHLGIPFVRDQDVQRTVTSSFPLWDILTGPGLLDRHPPFYFVVLHLAQQAGQHEWNVRLPAALCGALAAPIFVWASGPLRARASAGTCASAAVIALAPALVASAREVSDIPLFTIELLAMIGFTHRAIQEPTRARTIGVTVFHALALFTYHLASFAIAGELLVIAIVYWRSWADRHHLRVTIRWALYGIAAGSPAVVHAVVTFFRDRGSRESARAFPELAWGNWDPLSMLREIGAQWADALGAPILFVAAAAIVILAIRSADAWRGAMLALGSALVAMASLAALTPVARMQPYYALSVVPLLLLVFGSERVVPRSLRMAFEAAVALSCTYLIATNAASAAHAYVPDDSIPRHVHVATTMGAEQIVTVAHYDAILVAYYLAREHHRALNGRELTRRDGILSIRGIDTVVAPLVESHRVRAGTPETAVRDLRRLLSARPSFVVTRDAFSIRAIEPVLAQCRLVDQGSETTLLDCRL